MALVKYGGGIVQMSGSIAGSVFARNKSGNYVRPRTKPVNPKSEGQETIRTILGTLAEYWHTVLDATQRGLWEDYAKAVGMTNKLAETIYLSGFNHFIRANAFGVNAGLLAILDGPSILSLPAKDMVVACTEENVEDQEFTIICGSTGWAPDGETKRLITISMGRPQLVSRTTFHGPWRQMGSFTAVTGPHGSTSWPAPFAFAVGQKVWFRARLQTVSGRTSSPWQLKPRTIIAD